MDQYENVDESRLLHQWVAKHLVGYGKLHPKQAKHLQLSNNFVIADDRVAEFVIKCEQAQLQGDGRRLNTEIIPFENGYDDGTVLQPNGEATDYNFYAFVEDPQHNVFHKGELKLIDIYYPVPYIRAIKPDAIELKLKKLRYSEYSKLWNNIRHKDLWTTMEIMSARGQGIISKITCDQFYDIKKKQYLNPKKNVWKSYNSVKQVISDMEAVEDDPSGFIQVGVICLDKDQEPHGQFYVWADYDSKVAKERAELQSKNKKKQKTKISIYKTDSDESDDDDNGNNDEQEDDVNMDNRQNVSNNEPVRNTRTKRSTKPPKRSPRKKKTTKYNDMISESEYDDSQEMDSDAKNTYFAMKHPVSGTESSHSEFEPSNKRRKLNDGKQKTTKRQKVTKRKRKEVKINTNKSSKRHQTRSQRHPARIKTDAPKREGFNFNTKQSNKPLSSIEKNIKELNKVQCQSGLNIQCCLVSVCNTQ